jgi:hypothetical protein
VSERSLSRGALRAVLSVGGLVATAAGLDTAFRGAKSLPGHGEPAGRRVESELRFYGAIYVGYGIAMLRVAPSAERETTAVRALAGTLFLAGLARAGGWRAVGRPHRAQLALLAIELLAPPLITAWQARLAERG